jgi:CBS-domain-containing membrane protein
MPDVGLFTATNPVPTSNQVVVRYSVLVEGLEVYNESYDVDTLARELKENEAKALDRWARRLRCVVACRHKHGFSACLTGCLATGSARECPDSDETK